ncbi:hypothetical protein IW261DRAFT_654687 [Armillaria novae-zelandiae]|uniref:Uncharacterized protein n=1 Tax=Armillaria novae-zelandiae TaxID=153914 RepID=A0AA39PP32_9AGAR|nr:hypothetical protein IW261DRAFT_654687 [Armillaria novae-zelandiae]
MSPKKETSRSCARTTISPMLATPDTSMSFSLDSPDVKLQLDLDPALPDSSSPDLRSLLLSIPPEILPNALRLLTAWRLQQPRPALPTPSVLTAEMDCCSQPGRRIRWISKEYHAELERESTITDYHEHDTYSQHSSHLDSSSSQLRRDCHVPLSNPTPTIKPGPTTAISTAIPTTKTISTTLTRKSISAPTRAPTSTTKGTSRPVAKSKSKANPRADAENVPPLHVPVQPRRRPAAGKSRIPAPARTVFGSHNA